MMTVMHFDRGTWQPTVFNTYARDFCAVMFDKELSWYKYWLKYFANREEISEKCIGTKGVSVVKCLPEIRL